MGLMYIMLIAASLSMDAFAVSVSNGLSVKGISKKDIFIEGLFFGGFQFIMPVIGFILGFSVKRHIEAFDHWIAFGLLALIGVNMIKESLESGSDNDDICAGLSVKTLLVQAVATSIDALAVGVSFAVLDVNIFSASAVIGIVCFFISVFGSLIGKRAGGMLKKYAETAGGAILILIGLKILAEHIFF
ncbi:manganese efflux pump MntP family protein [Lachnospiraceae bacterium NSJ-143]|nr:manganese efflux pump MntP family protein [Lachnospiraceae bacterium NSJ-143]